MSFGEYAKNGHVLIALLVERVLLIASLALRLEPFLGLSALYCDDARRHFRLLDLTDQFASDYRLIACAYDSRQTLPCAPHHNKWWSYVYSCTLP